MIESQIRYVAAAIAEADKHGAQALAPTRGRTGPNTTTSCRHDLSSTVWNTGGCRSWYLDEHGVNRSLWSGLATEYWLATGRFKPAEYRFPGVGREAGWHRRLKPCPTRPTQQLVLPRDVAPQL